ncbi:MAG: hypothetical protein LBP40_03840 [Campylobacteraceae bacterium]|jgi:hypothetical protein|nr:hypothetical protein [Campylobacteraceae bacterium]
MLKQIFITSVIVFLLTGCNTDSNSNKKTAGSEPPQLDRGSSLIETDDSQDGIRDDIKNYIIENYPDERQKNALLQDAKAVQAILLVDINDKEAVRKADEQDSRAIHCIFSVFDEKKDTENPSIVSDKILSMTTNTKERLQAYLAFNKALEGTVATLPEGDTCE